MKIQPDYEDGQTNGIIADTRGPKELQQAYPFVVDRQPFVSDDQHHLDNAGAARANYAPDYEHPDGSPEWRAEHENQTVLQQHIDFFDTDHDHIIWPVDTYKGLRRIGWNILLSAVAAAIIHLPFSYPTVPTWFPDPFFRIYMDNIHKTKHGSDTNTYDHEGRFVPQKFEDWWSKYGNMYDGEIGASKVDIWNAVKAQRVVLDFFGQTAEILEWAATYIAIWPEDGIIRKEEARRMYDGSIFGILEQKEIEKKRSKQKLT